MRRRTAIGVAAILVGVTSSGAAAQERERGVYLGPVGIAPSLLAQVGTDDNVFNSSISPQADVTGTVNPSVRVFVPLRRSVVSGTASVSLVRFGQFTTQSSFSPATSVRWELPVNRLTAFAAYSFSNSHTRPNAEIDTRASQKLRSGLVGARLRISPRFSVGGEVRRSNTAFEEGEEFQGIDLSRTLNRETETYIGSVNFQITPFTRLSVDGDIQVEDFDSAPGRRSVGRSITPRLEFAPSALVSGTLAVGYTSFDLSNPLVEDYSGLTARVDLSYVLRDATRFSVGVDRHVVYSFSVVHPYYVQTAIGVRITQQVSSTWDVVVGAGRQIQDYESVKLPGGAADAASPSGTVVTYQAGLGRRIRRSLRVGVDVSRVSRVATLTGNYVGTRVSTLLNYAY